MSLLPIASYSISVVIHCIYQLFLTNGFYHQFSPLAVLKECGQCTAGLSPYWSFCHFVCVCYLPSVSPLAVLKECGLCTAGLSPYWSFCHFVCVCYLPSVSPLAVPTECGLCTAGLSPHWPFVFPSRWRSWPLRLKEQSRTGRRLKPGQPNLDKDTCKLSVDTNSRSRQGQQNLEI